MTREELYKLFKNHIHFDYVLEEYVISSENIKPLIDNVLELHEDKVKQLAIFLNK